MSRKFITEYLPIPILNWNWKPMGAQWFTNQMRVCVDRTVNLCRTVCKRFTYNLPRTEKCQFFAQTQRELDAPGVLCSPQVCGKLITRGHLRTARKRRSVCKQHTRVYKALNITEVTLRTLSVGQWCHCSSCPFTNEPILSSNHLERRTPRLRRVTPISLVLCTVSPLPHHPVWPPSTSVPFFVTLWFSNLVPYVLILKMFHVKKSKYDLYSYFYG